MSETPATFDLLHTPIARGITLVEASAGTGKTYSLTGLVLRLLLEDPDLDVGRILVMTFTNAATAELVERIRRTLGTAAATFRDGGRSGDAFLRELARRHGQNGLRNLERALRDLDDLEVCTIHGFCRRMLDQNAFETGTAFDVEYAADDGTLLTAAGGDFWRRTLYGASDLVTAVVAHRGWTPSSFLEDFRKCRRHPRIDIRPSPLSIDDAAAALEQSAATVRTAWNAAAITEILTGAKYKKGERMTRAERTCVIADADAFCTGATPSALGALLALDPDVLEDRLFAADMRRYAATDLARAVPALTDAIAAFEHALRCAFIREVDGILEDAKRATGLAHYDDLLLRLFRALEDPAREPALRRAVATQYEAVLVDEFQDTDTIQYDIFRRLFAGTRLVLVGDPKQAIYGFRGADVFAYLRAKDDAGRTPYRLDTNHRSEASLVTAVNELFSRKPRPFVIDAISFQKVRAAGSADETPLTGDDRRALEWIWLEPTSNKEVAAKRATSATVAEIVHLLTASHGLRIGDRPVEPRDIAVLVRSNRRAEQVQAALRTAGVPSVVSQAESVFETGEARELHRMLAAVATPRDAGTLRAALATRAFGHDAAAIAALGDDDGAWQGIVDGFEKLRETWIRRGFVAMAEEMLSFAGARSRLLAHAGGARRLTNLLHLVELTEQAVEEHHLTPDGAVAWLARIRANPKLFPEDAAEVRLETDADAVQICTVHKSKGLEYGIVFCPFTWEAGTDDPRKKPVLAHDLANDRVIYQYPPPDPEVTEAGEKERLSEEARLLYVSLTRARHRCYVVWGDLGTKSAAHAALAHVLHGGAPPEQWRAQLGDLCAEHSDVMAVRDHDATLPNPRWENLRPAPCELREREFPPGAQPQLVPWRVASFSSLRAAASAQPTPSEAPDYIDPSINEPTELVAPRGIFAFAKGARAGTCLHEIFEKCDFARVGDAATAELVAAALRRHGLDDPSSHAARIDPGSVVLDMLDDVLGSRLPATNLSLSSIARDRMLAEWQFHLPIGSVSQSKLAEVFARYGRGPVSERYPPLLRALGGREIHGFLMGFVDLVFTHEERWYVVDWKSNHLGNDVAAYADDALVRAMCEHHYVLQYHLYALALHRYLRQRLSDYDYERHFAGAGYAFLRGMRRGHAGGWYFDRPPLALIEALDEITRGETAT